jgi:NADH:ubiquinone oxidoreductase subunit 5 (subunit L)/multisubunit Na+/H+ antiporter MnhA subunit
MLICTLAHRGRAVLRGLLLEGQIIQAGCCACSTRALRRLVAVRAARARRRAALTAFYMFRLIFLTFFGEYRGNQRQHRFSAMLAREGVEGRTRTSTPSRCAHAARRHGHGEHGPTSTATRTSTPRDAPRPRPQHAPRRHAAHASRTPTHEAHGGHGEHAHEPHESPLVMTVALDDPGAPRRLRRPLLAHRAAERLLTRTRGSSSS